MATLREIVTSAFAAQTVSDPGGMPTEEELAGMRAAHGAMMEVSNLLTDAVTRSGAEWDDLHFAATFDDGMLTMTAGGHARRAADDDAAASAMSRALQEHDLVGVVTVVLPPPPAG